MKNNLRTSLKIEEGKGKGYNRRRPLIRPEKFCEREVRKHANSYSCFNSAPIGYRFVSVLYIICMEFTCKLDSSLVVDHAI
eukprot:1157596-Pelagomonas_calceolata.AAC.15